MAEHFPSLPETLDARSIAIDFWALDPAAMTMVFMVLMRMAVMALVALGLCRS